MAQIFSSLEMGTGGSVPGRIGARRFHAVLMLLRARFVEPDAGGGAQKIRA